MKEKEYIIQEFIDIAKENDLDGKDIAEFVGLKHSSYRVALTKKVMPKWLRIGVMFYNLGLSKGLSKVEEFKNQDI